MRKINLSISSLESVKDFSCKLGMKPCMHLVKKKAFLQLTFSSSLMYQPPQTSQNSDFQSNFSLPKIEKEYCIVRTSLIKNVLEKLDF